MKVTTGRRIMMVISISLIFFSANAFTQEKDFPNRPINLYLGYPPGGGTAIVAQILAEEMKTHLNQPVIVNFKPGAAQAVAADFVSKSKPDGYTILFLIDLDIILKLIQDGPTLKFGLGDFVSLGETPGYTFMLVVKSDSPWNSIEDFVDFGRKSKTDKMTIGSSGLGNQAHMIAELFIRKTGIAGTYIPFQGGGPADVALLGGHLNMAVGSVGRYVERLKPGGGLRALAVTDKNRHPNYPNVPTLLEKGYDVVVECFGGLHAPKGLPIPIKNKLSQAFEKAANDPKIVSMFAKDGYTPLYHPPEEMDRRNQADYTFYENFLSKSGLINK